MSRLFMMESGLVGISYVESIPVKFLINPILAFCIDPWDPFLRKSEVLY